MDSKWNDCEKILHDLVDLYKLEINKRIGLLILWSEKNIGDMYFLAASLSYAQEKVGKKCIVIAPKNFTVQKFIDWHNANGADIEVGFIDCGQLEVLKKYKNKIDKIYVDLIEIFTVFYRKFPIGILPVSDVHENLTRPRFPHFDKTMYIEKYGVVPEKTIFVIPESNYHGTLPLYFWTMSIEIFKLLGYKVIVNAKAESKKYGDVSCCFVPLDDLVNFCNLCGNVYSIRTGLSEFIASETTANMFIFTMPDYTNKVFMSVMLMYPHIDNSDGHINEIAIPLNKHDFSWIKNASDTFRMRMDRLRENIQLRDVLLRLNNTSKEKTIRQAKTLFYRRRYDEQFFIDRSYERCVGFCDITYKIDVRNALIFLSVDIRPLIDYEIHIALKDTVSNKIICRYEYYNSLDIIFNPDEDGEYCAVVHIIHPENGRNCLFETDVVSLYRSLEEKLRRCKDFNIYTGLLNKWKHDLVVFVTSKDSHINYMQNKKINLSGFKISTDLMHTFRYSWLCVIDSGNVVRELSSENKELNADYVWNGNKAHITSAGYNVNSDSKCSVSIEINGEQLCVNQRGLNFVVWDKRDNRLLDSVCFDTYYDGFAARLQ